MSKNFKLLFQSFFNCEDGQRYIGESDGTGKALLATLALLVVVVSVCLYAKSVREMYIYFDQDMAQIFSQAPEMVVQDGELVWQDDDLQHFTYETGSGRSIRFLTVDTRRGHIPDAKDVRQAIIYVTKKEIHLSQGDKTNSFPLAAFNSGLKKNPLNMTSPESVEGIMLASKVAIGFSLAIFVVVFFLGSWLFFVMMAWSIGALSTLIISFPDKLDMSARKRMAALSVVPPVLFILVLKLLFLPWKFFLTPLVIMMGGLCFMKKHASYMQNQEQ